MHFAFIYRVIHRDLKSENCLIRIDGSAVVADFGLARVMEGEVLTSTATPHDTAGTACSNNNCCTIFPRSEGWRVWYFVAIFNYTLSNMYLYELNRCVSLYLSWFYLFIFTRKSGWWVFNKGNGPWCNFPLNRLVIFIIPACLTFFHINKVYEGPQWLWYHPSQQQCGLVQWL